MYGSESNLATAVGSLAATAMVVRGGVHPPGIPRLCRRLKISQPEKEKHFNMGMERGEEIVDVFNGHKFKWVWICRRIETGRNFYNPRDLNSTMRPEVRPFELTFHKKNRDMVIDSYLSHIANQAKIMKLEKKTIKIFTVDYDNVWKPVTLDTLAMDSDQKDLILKDVDRFLRRRDYYRKVGKAWKRLLAVRPARVEK